MEVMNVIRKSQPVTLAIVLVKVTQTPFCFWICGDGFR
jgi:hypothetical protein